MSSTETPSEITVQCPDCEETATGPEKGPNNANFRLAGHRVRAHGYRKPDAAAKGGKAPRQRGVESVSTAVIRSIGEGARPASGRAVTAPPTKDDLSRGLGRGVQILTVVAAAYAAETDDSLKTEEARDALVRDLSLSHSSAVDIMDPIGNALAPTSINKRYGRQVIDNIDALASVGELVKLGFRWRRYFRIREAALQAMAGRGEYMAPGAPGQAPAPGEVRVQAAPAAPTPQAATPPPNVGNQGMPLGPNDDVGDHTVTREQYVAAQPATMAVPDVGAQAYAIDGTPAAPMQGRIMTPEAIRAMRTGQ